MQVVKVSEVSGVALDWLVAKASQPVYSDTALVAAVRGGYDAFGHFHEPFNPSTKWAQGGPIIERIKGLQFKHWLESKPESCCEVHIHNYEGDWIAFGPTPLVAAMRCYCCSKLGDVVDIPEELCQ